MKPYFILAPPWDNVSAGGVVLHSLGQYLHHAGAEVYMGLQRYEQNPNWIIFPCIDEYKDDRKDTIAIYPEILNDNPFQCGKTIRYLLHIPGYFGTPANFPSDDLLFVYSRFFNQRIKLPEERIVNIPCLNPDVFYDRNLVRRNKYFYIGKGRINLDHENLKDAIKALENISENNFTVENIKDALMLIANILGSRGELLHPVRYALSGLDKSPDPFIIASILGKNETLSRLQQAV